MGELDALLEKLTAAPEKSRKAQEAAALKRLTAFHWIPNPGPQTDAFFCEADETLFGGEAGGGKSDLLLGLGLNSHQRGLILRRVNTDVDDLGDRLVEIYGSKVGYNAQKHTLRRAGGKLLELKGCEHEKDKLRFKGRPHDLKGFDELSDFLESQYLFIIGWNRSATDGQRCRVVATTNGPTTPEAQWIVRRWAPWLDPSHPKPAKSGEIRWFLRIENRDVEVDGPGPHDIEGRGLIKAKSRTFIRSKLSDNPDLARTDYRATLDGLEEDVRRAIGEGDFTVGLKDDEYQVIPTAWIELAMDRWKPKPPPGARMTSMGVDVAQGGTDNTVIARCYGGWVGELDVEPGTKTKEGHQVAAMVVRTRRDACPVIVDAGGGYGTDTIKVLAQNGIDCHGYLGVGPSTFRTKHGKIKCRNKRAETYWRLREQLDPEQEGGAIIALPNDPILKADLASVRRKELGPGGLTLESKDEIKERLGRSPDRGDAVAMGLVDGLRALERRLNGQMTGRERQEQANMANSHMKARR